MNDSSYTIEPGKIVAVITWLYGIPGMCYLSVVFLSMYFVARSKFVPTNVLMMNILIVDWSIITLFTVYCAPCEWAGKPVYGKLVNYMAGIHETYAFTVSLISSCIICLNRFIVIFLPSEYGKKIFTIKATYFYAVSTWFLGTFWPIAELYHTPCHLIFDEHEFTFKLVCPDPKDPAMELNMIFAFSFLSPMGFLYAVSLVKLRWGSRRVHDAGTQTRGTRRNIRIFIQAFGVWLSILLNVLGFNFVVYLKNEVLIGTAFLVLVLCPAMGSCTVILIFNHDVRRVVRAMIAFKSVSTNRIFVTAANAPRTDNTTKVQSNKMTVVKLVTIS